MNDGPIEKCPQCGVTLERGFSHRSLGLSFVVPEKLQHFAFIDEDLAHAGLRKLLPSRVEFFQAYLCRSCELYLIDFSKTFDRAQAEQLARSWTLTS
jgi:hypothetical protein